MKLLTHPECALAVGKTPRQLRRLVERHGLPADRRGRGWRVRYDIREVKAWLADRSRRCQEDIKNRELARQIILSLADSAAVRFRTQSGPFKFELAVNVVCGFYDAASAVRRNLGLPELTDADVPEPVRQLDRLIRSHAGAN